MSQYSDDDVEDSLDEQADAIHPDDSLEMVPCPYCGKLMHELALNCLNCGNYISEEDTKDRKPLWIVLATIAILIAFLLTAFR